MWLGVHSMKAWLDGRSIVVEQPHDDSFLQFLPEPRQVEALHYLTPSILVFTSYTQPLGSSQVQMILVLTVSGPKGC